MKTHPSSKTTGFLAFSFSSIIFRLLGGVMVGMILLFLLPVVVPYIDDAQSFGYIRGALALEQALTQVVKSQIPTIIAGKDMTRWIVILGVVFVSGLFNRYSERFTSRAEYLKFRGDIDEWKRQMHLSDNAIVLSPLTNKLEQLKSAGRKDREQLLREFAETKRKLDAMGRDLAFLAIDVVDSTGMKDAEERATVEHDFKEYKRFVERTLNMYGCLKSAWTPDGVMSCFTTVDAAVKASRDVITGLDAFNAHIKMLRREFRVRCGVNAGFVYFDDTLPLQEISDRVIDVAGHLQKKAKPNTVCVAKPAIEPLDARAGFEPAGTTVDGYEVYEWRKS